MPLPSPTLEEVAAEFQLWRSKKLKKSEATPAYLKDMIKHLLPHYTKTQILKKLGVGFEILDSIKCNTRAQEDAANQPISFIPFKLTTPELPESTHNSDAIPCKIIKTDGNQLIINSNNPTQIIKAFLCSSLRHNQ